MKRLHLFYKFEGIYRKNLQGRQQKNHKILKFYYLNSVFSQFQAAFTTILSVFGDFDGVAVDKMFGIRHFASGNLWISLKIQALRVEALSMFRGESQLSYRIQMKLRSVPCVLIKTVTGKPLF